MSDMMKIEEAETGGTVAWLHTLHMGLDGISVAVDFEEEHPFGEQGEDYDPTYHVTSQPLCLSTQASSAQERFAAWINEGPNLAAAAGCHVGIKVTEAKSTAIREVLEGGAS